MVPVTAARPGIQGLEPLFDPRSVAVVGASDNPEKWGYWLATGALSGRHRRAVHLINQNGGSLNGFPFLPGLNALAAPPEHVVVAVPPAAVRQVVVDGLTTGARCFTVITSGCAADDESELASLVAVHGARLLGPNCMGVVDTSSELRLTWGDFPAGSVGLVSQSGNLALEIGRLLARAGQGMSRFVSLGNQSDIDAADALEALTHHGPTRVVAAYVEDFRDGRRMVQALAAARSAGKPVLLLTVGRSTASQRAAASHTGALVSPYATVAAACREAGALLLDSAGELVDTAVALLSPALPAGRRVAVAGDSGGQGALAADTLAAHGLELPELSPGTVQTLTARLPPGATPHNPADLAGAGEADFGNYAHISRALLASGDADTVLLTGYFGDYATANPAQEQRECEVARSLCAAVDEHRRPLVVHSMARDTAALAVLRAHGVPVYERIEQAAAALAGAARWRASSARSLTDPGHPAVPPVSDGSYRTIRNLLLSQGLHFPDAVFVHTADEAARAAHRLGFPLVLKAMGLAHKTEAGGVALGLRDEAELRHAFAAMARGTGSAVFAVEAMAAPAHAVELIAGVRRDPVFGPVTMVGLGGVTAELHADTALALAPLTADRARQLLLSLHSAPLLAGWRGAPPVDLDAAAAALVLLADVALRHPELSEIEVNPLLAHPGGVIALDAHAVPVPTDDLPKGHAS
ncbi:acetate--CoA ligase family protein [Streptomyces sp. NPDC001292]|uniref:acetate--CoA ligase family protein n=1 Tax=Streptomyces sp. NPDC001292 TaxID=3364558 RepID=UPI0036CFCC0D